MSPNWQTVNAILAWIIVAELLAIAGTTLALAYK